MGSLLYSPFRADRAEPRRDSPAEAIGGPGVRSTAVHAQARVNMSLRIVVSNLAEAPPDSRACAPERLRESGISSPMMHARSIDRRAIIPHVVWHRAFAAPYRRDRAALARRNTTRFATVNAGRGDGLACEPAIRADIFCLADPVGHDGKTHGTVCCPTTPRRQAGSTFPSRARNEESSRRNRPSRCGAHSSPRVPRRPGAIKEGRPSQHVRQGGPR